MKEFHKYPRVLVEENLRENHHINITGEIFTYLVNVMRLKTGNFFRVFNETNGEFLVQITDIQKKTIIIKLLDRIRKCETRSKLYLYFPLIKHDRLRFMVEKSVELGVTDLIPVITEYTNRNNIKTDKLEHYIIEATEQSERLDKPYIHKCIKFDDILDLEENITVAIERENLKTTNKIIINNRIFIGPEGGFSPNEKQKLLNKSNIHPISLGDIILRSETAAITLLSLYQFCR